MDKAEIQLDVGVKTLLAPRHPAPKTTSANKGPQEIKYHYNRRTYSPREVCRTLQPVSATRELTSFSFSEVQSPLSPCLTLRKLNR
ncbi:hypothetical protein MATL_G00142610 [Megalops atlanticus]|uniref:Uncharacterized protein n=1 Tax=Megalops atlanticus TaxID=7932 RepID=A0A9D3T648_MEGAT|nr:hypothetical protein MATL_G00142610 [Megalops atlanticus]